MFQELSLIPDLTVADNISISAPPKRFGMIDQKAQVRRAEELLARVRCEDVDPRAMIRDLSLSRRQMVEIAKALGRNPKVLILDEATSALTAKDVQTVYELASEGRGICSLFISHASTRLKLVGNVVVFRNGSISRRFQYKSSVSAPDDRPRCGSEIPPSLKGRKASRS